jgi:hypothetical protein
MVKTIYVQLLDEGSVAYRPVSAHEIKEKVYRLDASECYDPADETWEFVPGTCVLVEERIFDGERFLVAIKEQKPI